MVEGPPVRVLIVDDSAVVRGSLGRMLDAEPDLKVVTTATNGRHAIDAVAAHAIDVVVLDVEMPEMDGLTALPLLLKQRPGMRVLMLSAHGGRGADVTVRALALGAADFVCKPRAGARGGPARVLDVHVAELTQKIRALGRSAQRVAARAEPPRERVAFAAPVVRSTLPTTTSTTGPAGPAIPVLPPRPAVALREAAVVPRSMQVLAIASSTGGPVALAELLGALPPKLDVPVLVTQHMPPEFTRLLAERLAVAGRRPCAEARDGEVLRRGHVYVAPGDHHMLVERRGGEVRVRLTQDRPVQHCRPAADPMFASIAAAFGPGALAVVLTGMGHDGRDGAAAIVHGGGRVLAQDEATSVVWGMPGAVAQAGLAAAVLPIPQIATHVAACCATRPKLS
ncbi:MAG TPA: chemotaxis-specific protein-glutamate methyltransferase CheB [Gemmatirosa sp.]